MKTCLRVWAKVQMKLGEKTLQGGIFRWCLICRFVSVLQMSCDCMDSVMCCRGQISVGKSGVVDRLQRSGSELDEQTHQGLPQ